MAGARVSVAGALTVVKLIGTRLDVGVLSLTAVLVLSTLFQNAVAAAATFVDADTTVSVRGRACFVAATFVCSAALV